MQARARRGIACIAPPASATASCRRRGPRSTVSKAAPRRPAPRLVDRIAINARGHDQHRRAFRDGRRKLGEALQIPSAQCRSSTTSMSGWRVLARRTSSAMTWRRPRPRTSCPSRRTAGAGRPAAANAGDRSKDVLIRKASFSHGPCRGRPPRLTVGAWRQPQQAIRDADGVSALADPKVGHDPGMAREALTVARCRNSSTSATCRSRPHHARTRRGRMRPWQPASVARN